MYSSQLILRSTIVLTSRFHLNLRQAASPEYPSQLMTTTTSGEISSAVPGSSSTNYRPRLYIRNPRLTVTNNLGNTQELSGQDFIEVRVNSFVTTGESDEQALNPATKREMEHNGDLGGAEEYEMTSRTPWSSAGYDDWDIRSQGDEKPTTFIEA